MSHLQEYPTLGFDPAPGRLTGVEALAHNFSRVATMLAETHAALSQIGRAQGIWLGEAAEKFQGAVGELPGYLEKGKTSLGTAAGILGQWQHDLASMQATARDYEAQAKAALDRVRQAKAHPDFALAGQHFPDDASLAVTEFASRHETPDIAVEGLLEFHRQHGDPSRVALPAGPAVVVVTEEPLLLHVGEQSAPVLRWEVTAWVPDPFGTRMAVVSLATNSWQDWDHVCGLALEIFDSLDWAPAPERSGT